MVTKVEHGTVPPDLIIKVGSKRLEQFMAVSIKCHYEINNIPWAEVILSTADNAFELHEDELKLCLPGNDISITTKIGNLIFSGIVVQAVRNSNVVRSELVLSIRHPLQKLAAAPRNEIYEQQSDASIIRSLCSTQSIKLAKVNGLDIRHSQMVQFRSSDWHFMLARLKANGVWLIPSADAINFLPPQLKTKADFTLNWPSSKEADIFISDASWRLNNQNLTKSLDASGWNIQEQKIRTVKAKTTSLGTGVFDASKLKVLTNEPWHVTKTIPYESGELEALAAGKLQTMQLNSISGRYELAGSTKYKVGDTIALNGFGKSFDGTALVTEVEQLMVQGLWRTTVSVGSRDPWAALDVSSVPAAIGNYVAVVEAFQQDPEKLERFKIRIPALFQSGKTLWARLGTPYAGKGHGFYFYPKIGDEVIVCFFENDPRYPVIVGSMFNPKSPPAYPANQDGQMAIVFDSDKKQSITFDSKQDSLVISSGEDAITMAQGVTLQSSKTIVTQGENLDLSSKQRISIKANSSVGIKSPKIEMDQ